MNPIWKLYLNKMIPRWKLYLAVLPESVIENHLRKPIKSSVEGIMKNQEIMNILFDKKFFMDIKNRYGEKGIRAAFNVTAKDVLDELKPYNSHKKIKLIYDYLNKNKSSLQDIINNLKGDM